jgi:uncharacterized OB-fold protein
MSPERLLPPVDVESAPFWEGARRGELRVQCCGETGRLIFPPRARSPFASRLPPEWTSVSGHGTIWSYVVPHPPLLPQFAELAPYNVILVALAEDPTLRLVGNLVVRAGGRINEIDPKTLRIGAPVRVVFERVTDEIHMPRWMLAEAA